MAPDMVPEIRRTNLANTVLYLKCVGVADVLGASCVRSVYSVQCGCWSSDGLLQ
jgi:hypothetical protein